MDTGIADAAAETLSRLAPDLVVVSGDLTQRARTCEFEQAHRFLERLPSPRLVVAGNHDISLYNLYARLVHKLAKFRRFITEDLEPAYVDEEIAVAGVNTVRSFAWKEGRVNGRQIERVCERFQDLPASVTKIVVAHHPFDLPEQRLRGEVAGRARMALERLAECGVDLLLAGHLHFARHTDPAAPRIIGGHPALLVQAGTAISSRNRGQPNSFNVLKIRPGEVETAIFFWQTAASQFAAAASQRFVHGPHGWMRSAEDRA